MKALIVVDLQNDFMEGGSLPVQDALSIVPIANQIMKNFNLVIGTKDWHPQDHKSFASTYEDKKPGDRVQLNGIDQVLWPVHCVQNSSQAAFVSGLKSEHFQYVIEKGTDPEIDSYSAFFDNAHLRSTGLDTVLKNHHVSHVFILGVATDFCVKYTAQDALHLGYQVSVIVDACRGVNLQVSDSERALWELHTAGAQMTTSLDILTGVP